MSRYQEMFHALQARSEGAFIPFVVLLDPNPQMSLDIIRTMVKAGADALELGIAYSDPLADGPTIQKADLRVLNNRGTVKEAFSLVAKIRSEFPRIPIGLLTYANIVFKQSPEHFYELAEKSGVDSILVADVPMLEIKPYADAARIHKIDLVLIAPPNLPKQRIPEIARLGRGYTYVVTRRGVTGADTTLNLDHADLVKALRAAGAPPAIFGFGISKPEHVEQALKEGAQGVISGSKIVSLIEEHLHEPQHLLKKINDFVQAMKAATRGA